MNVIARANPPHHARFINIRPNAPRRRFSPKICAAIVKGDEGIREAVKLIFTSPGAITNKIRPIL